MVEYWPQFVRAFAYAGIATILALIIAYPLAYFIAFKAGSWRSLLLVLVIAPSFASFLLRAYAWKTILADDGPITSTLNALHLLPDGRVLNTGIAVVAGLTYNFLPFMILPLYAALEKIDHRLIEAAGDLYASTITAFRKVTWPLSLPGRGCRHAADLHPRRRRLHQRRPARIDQGSDDRQRHPDELHRVPRLPHCQCPVLRADVRHPHPGVRLHPQSRYRGAGLMRWLGRNLVGIIGIAVLVYLFVPIAVIIALSFNKPQGKFNLAWNEFSLNAWTNLCGVPGVCDSFLVSIQIGILATLVATVLGTMIAFALVRYRFRGRSSTNLLIFLPMATPEVVMGSSLLALFLNLRFPLGAVTVAIAHIMFIISFVVVTVKARCRGWILGWRRPPGTCTRARAPPSGTSPSPGPAGHRRCGPAGLLAVLRRLHHQLLQCRNTGDLPDLHLGGSPAGHPAAGQCPGHHRLPGRLGGRPHRPVDPATASARHCRPPPRTVQASSGRATLGKDRWLPAKRLNAAVGQSADC
jgi:ABC-type spermidine/putrescine transport system permease subunit I